MKFTPKTEEEVQAEQLCPVGIQPFTVLESAEVLSKSAKNAGKEMIKLKLNVHAEDGDYHCYDYIADWFMAHKFRHFFFAIGLGEQYEKGVVNVRDNALAGRTGYCDVGIQNGKDGYGPKNTIADYCDSAEKDGAVAPAKSVGKSPTGTRPDTGGENQPPGQGDDVPF